MSDVTSRSPEGFTQRFVSLAGSPTLAVINLVALAAIVLLLCSCERSVTTGVLITAWGAVACWLAHDAGVARTLDGRRVALIYVGASGVLFLILNGIWRLLGV